MEFLNRSAVIIFAKQPFLDWINSVEGESGTKLTLEEINHEGDVYLLDEYNTDEDFAEMLLNESERIFENELNGWYTDTSLWPENRTREMFHQWFDIKVASMIYDLCPWKLKKE